MIFWHIKIESRFYIKKINVYVDVDVQWFIPSDQTDFQMQNVSETGHIPV